MAKNLRLEVLLKAVDKVTAPMKKMRESNQKVAQAVKASRDELKRLDKAQTDIRSFRELSQKAKETSRSLSENQQRIAALTKEMKAAETPTRAMINERNQLIRQSKKLTETQHTEQERLRTLRQSIRTTEGTTGTLSERNKQLSTQIKQVNQQLKKQQTQLARTAERQRQLAKIRSDYQAGQARADAMIGTGAKAAATGTAAAFGAAAIMAPGVDLEKQLSELQAITRLSKESAEFQALAQQSRDLGGSTQFDAAQVAAGQTFLARAGFSADAIKASMGDMLAMAIANNTELARTADITSNISSAFKIDAEIDGNITRVADVLSGTAARANVDLEMLGETMKYLGGAEGLDLSLEQAAAMSGILGNIGIQGSMAGTTLRAMMNRLTGPTDKAAGVLDELGIKVSDANGNIRDLPTLLKEISTATEGMGNSARNNALQTIFGAEAGSGMAELVSGMASGQLGDLIGELQNLKGENARMATVMADNTAGDLASLVSAWQAVGDSIFTTNNGPIRQTIQSITAVTQRVNAWIKENPELTATIIKWGAALTALLVVGGGLLMFLGLIVKPILTAISVMKLLSVAVMGVSWPVLAVIAAITALAAAAYLIYDNWGAITEWVKNFIAGFKEAWEGGFWSLLEWSKNLFISIAKVFLDFSPMGLLYKGIATVLNWFGMELPTSFSDAGIALMDGLIGGISAKIKAVKDTITNVGSNVTGWFKNVMGINSPSRVFNEFGVNTLEGYENGLDDQQKSTLARVKGVAKQVTAAGAGMALTGAVAARDLPIDTRPPLSATPAATQPTGDTIEIHVHAAPGMDAEQLALLVRQQLDQRDREKARRSRASLTDRD